MSRGNHQRESEAGAASLQSWNVEAGTGDGGTRAALTAEHPQRVREGGRGPADCCRKKEREKDVGQWWKKRRKQRGRAVQRAEIPSCKQQTLGLCTIIFPLLMFRCIHAAAASGKEAALAERKPRGDGEKSRDGKRRTQKPAGASL